MKIKSAIVATAMLLAGVAAAANAQQDSSRAGQRQQVNADTSMKKQGKQWGTDSATPSGKKGVHEQDAVSGKNAAKTGQDSLKAGQDTSRTGASKMRSDSVSSSSSSSRPQQSSSSDTSSGTTSTYGNPSSPNSSSSTNSTTPNSSTSTSGATVSPTSSSVDANGRSTLSLASWMSEVAAVAKDQEISKNGQAPGASATSTEPSSSSSVSPSSSSSTSTASPSSTTTSTSTTTSSANSAYEMQEPKAKDASTNPSHVSGAAHGTTPNPTGDGNNPGHNPDSSRPEKQSSSTTGQQANAPNAPENRDNATTKSTTP